MLRRGLLPRPLAKVSRRGSPTRVTLFTAAIVSVLAGLIPLNELAALANAGTLVAFAAVALCMLIMRRREPDAARKFRAPAAWLIGPAAIAGCGYLFYNLPSTTQIYFVCAQVVGQALYWVYGHGRSVAAGRASSRGSV